MGKKRKSERYAVKEYKVNIGCSVCGYNKLSSALEFHHTDPNKDKDVSMMTKSANEKMWVEIDKCIVLCANCHREAHAGLNGVDLPERDTLMPKDVYEYGLYVIRSRAQMELFGNTHDKLSSFKLAAREVIIKRNLTEDMWKEMYSPEFWEYIKHYLAEGPLPISENFTIN